MPLLFPTGVPDQVAGALDVIMTTIGDSVAGVYLFGSATRGGLRPQSDLDVLSVVEAQLLPSARRALTNELLKASGEWPPRGSRRPIEMTVVNRDDVVPWRYPPRREFVYGEWLRRAFESGTVSTPEEDPDLAILLTIVRASSVTLAGSDARFVLDPVPEQDLRRAMLESVPRLLREQADDTRNVLLTLARIWASLETNEILSKDDAATWAAAHLPTQHRDVLKRARAAYTGASVDGEAYHETEVRAFCAHLQQVIQSYAS